MKSDFLIALTQLVAERHLPREEVLHAVEAALVSAFKKDSTSMGQDISVKLNPNTGEMSVFALRTVVEEVEDPTREISLQQAKAFNASISLGEEISTRNNCLTKPAASPPRPPNRLYCNACARRSGRKPSRNSWDAQRT